MRLSGRQPLGLPKKGAFLSAVRAAAAVAAFSQTFDFTAGMPAGVTVTSSPAGFAPKADGSLQGFAANAGRRTDLGLLIEPAATNYVVGSNPGGSPWTSYAGGSGTYAITQNAGTAPDGTTTASKVTVGRTTSADWAAGFTSTSYNLPTSGLKTLSYYIKAFAAGDVGKKVTVSLYNETLTKVAGNEITLTASWQRFSMVGTGYDRIVMGYPPNNNSSFGNVSTQTGTTNFLIWGCQVENGGLATSLIATTTATANRAADNVSITFPSGGNTAKLTFADNTIQYLDRGAGSYAFPTTLEGLQIKTLVYTSEVQKAIGSATFGTIFKYNSNYPTKYVEADTYCATWGDDDSIYATSCDTRNWNNAGPSGNVEFNRFTTYDTNTLGILVNAMGSWGSLGAKGSDNATYKASGLISIGGVLYMWMSRNVYGVWAGAGNNADNIQTAFGAQLIKSTDRGVTWTPAPPSTAQPYASPMFPAGTFGSPAFVQYGKDYQNINIHRAGTYVYAVSPNGVWNNGSSMVMGRCLKSALGNLLASDWTFYKGGDGMLDANWGTLAQAVNIISNTRKVSQAGIQYVPALKAYVMLQWYYPSVAANPATLDASTCTWDVYQSPTPWGPWSLVSSQTFNPSGVYNGFIIPKSIQNDGGLTMTVFAGGNFNNNVGGTAGDYTLQIVPITLVPGAAGSAVTLDA